MSFTSVGQEIMWMNSFLACKERRDEMWCNEKTGLMWCPCVSKSTYATSTKDHIRMTTACWQFTYGQQSPTENEGLWWVACVPEILHPLVTIYHRSIQNTATHIRWRCSFTIDRILVFKQFTEGHVHKAGLSGGSSHWKQWIS